METKVCGRCKQEKPLTEFYPSKRDGYRSRCKKCNKIEVVEYYKRPEVREYYHQWYLDHKEEEQKRSRQYRLDHKGERKEYDRQYYLDHKEELAQYSKQWRLDHKEEFKQMVRQFFQTPKGRAARQRGHTARRTRLNKVLNTLTAEEWEAILLQHSFRCAYCGCSLLDLFNPPTRDHVIPISKGGNNTKENIVPACRSCNSTKFNTSLVVPVGVR